MGRGARIWLPWRPFQMFSASQLFNSSGCNNSVVYVQCFLREESALFPHVWATAAWHRPEAGAMLTSLSPITPPPALSDMHYPWNYFHQTESPSSSSSAAGPLATNGGAFSWYGSRWPSNGDLKSPFGGVAPGNYFPSYDTSCFGAAATHHQLNVASSGLPQVSKGLYCMCPELCKLTINKTNNRTSNR